MKAVAAEPLPFIESFDTPDGFARFSVSDANNDNVTWHYNESEKLAEYLFSESNAANDYLFTPGFELKAGSKYVLTYKRHKRNYSSRERLAVTIGKSAEPSAHRPITDEDDHVAEITPTEQRLDFAVEDDGIYYIGFHCLSPKDLYFVKLDDVSLEESLDIPAPAAVTELSCTPAAAGELSVQIDFTVPEKDAEGNAVQALVSAALCRSDLSSPLKTWTEIKPNQAINYTDEPAMPGKYTYTVIVRNLGGSSAETSCTTFVGKDKPFAVSGLKVSENSDGSVTIRWNAPESDKGVNGGYAPAAELLYNVTDNNGRSIARNISSTSVTDSDIPYSEYQQQKALVYKIEAVNGTSYSESVQSDIIIAGTPYDTPAEESFMYATLSYYPWLGEGTYSDNGSYWMAVTYGASPRADAYDDDAGLVTFRSLAAPTGMSERFLSPKFDISQMMHPAVSFVMYHTASAYDTDKVHIEAAFDGGEFAKVSEDFMLGDPSGTSGWQLHRVQLGKTGAKTLRVAVVGTSANGHNIHLDVIKVYDELTDFTVDALSHSDRLTPSEPFEIKGNIYNNGFLTSNKPVTLTLDNGGGHTDTFTTAAPLPGESAEFAFTVTEPVSKAGKDITYTLTLSNDDDENADNDVCTFTIRCDTPPYPVVGGIKASSEGKKVTLTWNAAESYKDYPLTVDGFESYEAFAIDDAGPWKFVDIDQMETGENEDASASYANATAPMAYQVFCPIAAGVDLTDRWGQDWAPFEGSQYLASMYNADNRTPNDDWLISPAISPDKPVSFMARSLTNGYKKETFEFLYSTTGEEPGDFEVLTVESCPAEWLEYKYYLPSDAKYFAIRHTTPVAYCFMLDNLSCAQLSSEPTLVAPDKYNIYRNNELIATTTDTHYTDIAPDGNSEYEYSVSALFGDNESAAESIDIVTGSTTGIYGISEANITVKTAQGYIIFGAECQGSFAITDIAGRTVASGTLNGSHRVDVPAGVYFVRTVDGCTKVVVR